MECNLESAKNIILITIRRCLQETNVSSNLWIGPYAVIPSLREEEKNYLLISPRWTGFSTITIVITYT